MNELGISSGHLESLNHLRTRMIASVGCSSSHLEQNSKKNQQQFAITQIKGQNSFQVGKLQEVVRELISYLSQFQLS